MQMKKREEKSEVTSGVGERKRKKRKKKGFSPRASLLLLFNGPTGTTTHTHKDGDGCGCMQPKSKEITPLLSKKKNKATRVTTSAMSTAVGVLCQSVCVAGVRLYFMHIFFLSRLFLFFFCFILLRSSTSSRVRW